MFSFSICKMARMKQTAQRKNYSIPVRALRNLRKSEKNAKKALQ